MSKIGRGFRRRSKKKIERQKGEKKANNTQQQTKETTPTPALAANVNSVIAPAKHFKPPCIRFIPIK